MSKKKALLLLPLTFFLFIVSLVYVTITNNPFNNTPYYRDQNNYYNDLTVIIQKDRLPTSDTDSIKELFAKKTILENFTAQSDNLGILLIPFNTHNKSVDDKIVFRLKNAGAKKWLYQGTYDTNQIQTNVPFPVGFPIITYSINKLYTFEIESLHGRPGESIALSKTEPYFYTKYKFSKAELIKNPKILFQFIFIKTITQLPYLTVSQITLVICISLLPYILFHLFIFFKRTIYPKIYFQVKKYLLMTKKCLKEPLSREDKIRLCSLIVGVGFFCSLCFHYLQGGFYHQGYPQNTFLPNWFFGDFFGAYDEWSRLHFNGVGYGLSYFPGTYLIVNLFTLLRSPNLAVFIEFTIFSLFLFWYGYKNIKTKSILETLQNTFIISFMSYPVLFTFQTGNLEIFTFICVCLFLKFYTKHKMTANIFLAYAISMKVFPGIFLLLLLFDKRYKDILIVCICTVIFTILPLLIFDGGFNKGISSYLSHLSKSQQMYSDLMIISGAGTSYGNSLLNGIRVLFPTLITSMQSIILPYEIFIGIISLSIIGYLKFFEKVFWRKIAVLVMMMNLFPFTSTDYKLLYIFLPLFYFINYSEHDKLDIVFLILLSLLLIPKDYFYLNNYPLSTFNIVANAGIMLIILLIILVTRFTTRTGRLSSVTAKREK